MAGRKRGYETNWAKRDKFLKLYEQNGRNMSKTCREMKISRSTGQTWWKQTNDPVFLVEERIRSALKSLAMADKIIEEAFERGELTAEQALKLRQQAVRESGVAGSGGGTVVNVHNQANAQAAVGLKFEVAHDFGDG